MRTMGIRFPDWLVRTLSDYQRNMVPKKRSRSFEIEPCERRVLLSTFNIPSDRGSLQNDSCIIQWFDQFGTNELQYNINGEEFSDIPATDNNGSPYNDIEVDGTAGDETLTLNFSSGFFGQNSYNPDPYIHFAGSNGDGVTLNNTLVIEGGNGNDSVLLTPGQIVFTDPNGNSTTVTYGSGVSQLVFELGGGSNTVTVAGGDSFTWDNNSFPVAGNTGSTSLIVQANSDVDFDQSESLNSIEIQDDGLIEVADSPDSGSSYVLTTDSFTIDIGGGGNPLGLLDLTNNELDINYGGGSPVAAIRNDLIAGMDAPTGVDDTGNWNGTTGITSSTAEDNFPTALGYVDTASNPLTGYGNSTVVVRYTFYGDTNLDGHVIGILPSDGNPGTGNDGSNVAAFDSTGQSWATGDFNYSSNGLVNQDDYDLFASGENVSSTIPPLLTAVGTYQTRADLYWGSPSDTSGSPAMVGGFEIKYSSDGGNTWTSPIPIQEVSNAYSLVDDDIVMGQPASDPYTFQSSDGDVRETAITGLIVNNNYEFEICGVIDGLDTAWSSAATAATMSSAAGPLPQEPTAANGFTFDISVNSEEPNSIVLTTGSGYRNLWIVRIDDTTGVTEMLPVDHADFSNYNNGAPAFLDSGLNLADVCSYYACEQAGVPALGDLGGSYWQLLNPTQLNGAGPYYSYIPSPSVSNINSFESTYGDNYDIHLEWQADLNTENGFTIYAATGSSQPGDSSDYQEVGTTNSTTEDFDFTGATGLSLTPGETYWFEVAANTGGGTTATNTTNTGVYYQTTTTSEDPLAIPNAVPEPTQPDPAFSDSKNSISLSWSDWLSGASNLNFTKLIIEYSTDGVGFQPQPVFSTGDGSETTSNLNSGTTYYFRLRAVAADGVESSPSDIISCTTLPDSVSDFYAVAFGPNLVQLHWPVSSDPSPDIEYEVERELPNGQWIQISNPNDPNGFFPKVETEYNGMDVLGGKQYFLDDTNVLENEAYTYRIISYIVEGDQQSLGTTKISPPTITYPAAPTNLIISQHYDVTGQPDGIQLTWQDNSTADTYRLAYTTTTLANVDSSNEPQDGYVAITLDSSDITTTSINDVETSTFVFDSSNGYIASESGQYTFMVFANDAALDSAFSNVASMAASPAPTHVELLPISSTAIQVFWDYQPAGGPIDDIGDQLINGYQLLNADDVLVAWYDDTGSLVGSDQLQANQTSCIVQGLDSAQSYTFRIWTYNIDDSSSTIATIPHGSGWSAPSGIYQGRYSTWAQSNPETEPSSPLPFDTQDSYKLETAYQYIRNASDTHYAGEMSINAADVGWLEYDSAASALAVGTAGSVIVLDGDHGVTGAYLYSFPNGPFVEEGEGDGYNGLFSESQYSGNSGSWDYIALYEDTQSHIPFSNPTASGIDNGVIRWDVEEKSTLTVQPSGTGTIGGVFGAEFTITRSGDDSGALRVTYNFSASSGENGLYDTPSGVAIIPPGQNSVTVLVPLHTGYNSSIGMFARSLTQGDESANVPGSPYISGTKPNAVLVTAASNGSGMSVGSNSTNLIIGYSIGRGSSATLASLPLTQNYNIEILGDHGNDELSMGTVPVNDMVIFNGGAGSNILYYAYALSTANFDVYTAYVVETILASGATSAVHFSNAVISFTQIDDGSNSDITIHMVSADDTFEPGGGGDGSYTWNWGTGQQVLSFLIEDADSGYYVTLILPDGSTYDTVFIGGKGDM